MRPLRVDEFASAPRGASPRREVQEAKFKKRNLRARVEKRPESMAKGKKPLVVVTRKLPDTVETRMRELFDAQLNLDDRPMTQAELTEAVKVADVLVPTVTDRIDSSVLSHSGDKLRLIANFGNGVDNIDVATAL